MNWKERPPDKIMECARKAIKSVIEMEDGDMYDAVHIFIEELEYEGIPIIHEDKVIAALEIASKELDYEPGYLEDRDYPTEENNKT